MSYTIHHIRKINEAGPFVKIKSNLNKDNTKTFDKVSKLNNETVSIYIKKIVKIFVFCLYQYIQIEHFSNKNIILNINGHTYDRDAIRGMSCLNFKIIKHFDNDTLDDIDIPGINVNISGSTANISIKGEFLQNTCFYITRENAYSTKEFLVDALINLLHGIYDESTYDFYLMDCIKNWKDDLENALKYIPDMSFNIKYDITSPIIKNYAKYCSIYCYGITSWNDIENNFLSIFDNISNFNFYLLNSFNAYNSFVNSTDMADAVKLVSLFNCSRARNIAFNFYNNYEKLINLNDIEMFMYSFAKDIATYYTNTTYKGIKLSDFSLLSKINDNTPLDIYIQDPKHFGISNSLLDDNYIIQNVKEQYNDTRLSRFLYLYSKTKGMYTSRVKVHKIDENIVKLRNSAKVLNNIDNEEFNKYIITISKSFSFSQHIIQIDVTTSGS